MAQENITNSPVPPQTPFSQADVTELGLEHMGGVGQFNIPEGRECLARLKNELHACFANSLVGPLQPYLRQLAFESHRDSFSVPEKIALSGLVPIADYLRQETQAATGSLKPVGGSGDLFLRDVFYCLLDVANERSGNPLILRCTACPDYETDGDGHYVSRGGLGSSPGLAALKIVALVSPLLRQLSQQSIPTILELSYADIEALDPVLLMKSGVDTHEFQRRVDQSAAHAVERFSAELGQSGLQIAVRAGSMRALLGDEPSFPLQERLGMAGVTSSQISGIASHRRNFYSRFFRDQSQGFEVGEFYDARAAKDIDDHVRLGRATELQRKAGERLSLVTMSIPALAKYLRHGNDQVPVLALRQEY